MKRYYKYLILGLSLAYSASFAMWFQYKDLFYWMNVSTFYKEDFMQCLSLGLMHLWTNVVGTECYTFRLLGWLFAVTSILLPYFILIPREKHYQYLNCLSFGIVFFGGWTLQIFCPDSPTMLLFVGMLLAIFKKDSYSPCVICVLAVLSALAVACRFPNVLVVPLLACYLIIKGYQRHVLKHSILSVLLYVSLTEACYYIVIGLVCDRWDLLQFAKESILSTQDPSDTSHSIGNLLIGNIHNFFAGWVKLAALVSFMMLARYFGLTEKSPRWLQIFVPLATIAFYWFPARSGMLEGFYFGYLRMAAFAVVLLLLIWAKQSLNMDCWLRTALIIGSAFIASAGSDTSNMKMFYILIPFLPVILSKFWDRYSQHLIARSYLCAAVFISISSYTSNLGNQNHPVNLPNNQFQYSNREDVEKTEILYQEYLKQQTRGAVFFGEPAHRMYHTTGESFPYRAGFRMSTTNQVEIVKLTQYLKDSTHPTLFVYEHEENPIFDSKLSEIGYHMSNESKSTRIYRYE